MEEAELLARFLEVGGDGTALLARFRRACSPGFDPARHLERIGLANQTTVLSSESLAIRERLRQAVITRWGEAAVAEHYRAFDTICSATQDRQDAVRALLDEPLDLMLVVGGYNSSNTSHLAEMPCEEGVPAYHIDDAACILGPERIRHKPVGKVGEVIHEGWLPPGDRIVGLTAGASTPNNKVGEVIEALLRCRGVDPATL